MKKLHHVSVYVINHFCALTKHTFFPCLSYMSMYLFIRLPPPPPPPPPFCLYTIVVVTKLIILRLVWICQQVYLAPWNISRAMTLTLGQKVVLCIATDRLAYKGTGRCSGRPTHLYTVGWPEWRRGWRRRGVEPGLWWPLRWAAGTLQQHVALSVRVAKSGHCVTHTHLEKLACQTRSIRVSVRWCTLLLVPFSCFTLLLGHSP